MCHHYLTGSDPIRQLGDDGRRTGALDSARRQPSGSRSNGVDDSTLHYHCNKLLDVGLVQKRQRTDRARDGLYTYYFPTVFGEVTLTEGVDELIRGERAFSSMYDSSVDG